MATILLADDQETNRIVTASLLARRGHQVTEAVDGRSALTLVRARPTDLAVVDLLMPEMDGFEFVHELRHEPGPVARMPVIFITAAYLPEEVRALARACGVTHVLSRDEAVDTLPDVVEQALRSGTPDGPVASHGQFSIELLGVITRKLTEEMKSLVQSLTPDRDCN